MPISSKVASCLERGSFIRKMFEEGARLKAEHGGEKVFDFSLGNPPEEPPEAFHRELRRIVEDPIQGMHRYMPNAGFTWVRETVARTVAEESGLPVEGRHVIMTAGAGAAINVALKALLDPGEEVILLAPYFVEYGFYVENHGGRPVAVSTGEGFELDLNAIEDAVTDRTKAVILNSPNNPTGVVYPEEQITALGELLRRCGADLGRDLYLISDEPYKRLIYDGVSYPQVFRHVDNAIIAMSHSKDLALAGERIGYLAVSPRCADMERLLDAMVFANRTLGFVNAPATMQVLAARLQGVTIDIASYQRRRDILYEGLTSLGFETNKPQGAFYLFPKSPIPDDVAFVQAAQKRLILVVPGSGFGCPGHFRIAYSVPQETIERSMEAWAALAREFGLIS